jgi:hypothetical protein
MKTQDDSTRWGITYCEQRERLKDSFLDAVRDLAELQAMQLDAVIAGDSDFLRFEELIQVARQIKDNCKYALVAHMEDHCYRKSCEPEVTIYREVPSYARPHPSRHDLAMTH